MRHIGRCLFGVAVLATFAVLAVLAVKPVQAAAQKHFALTDRGQTVFLDYRFESLTGTQHELRLRLDKQALYRAESLFKPLDTKLLKQEVEKEHQRLVNHTVQLLGKEFPTVKFELKGTHNILWQVTTPNHYQQQRQDLFKQLMNDQVEAIRTQFPKVSIKRDNKGDMTLTARDEKQLRSVEQAMSKANQTVKRQIDQKDAEQQQTMTRLSSTVKGRVSEKLDTISIKIDQFQQDYIAMRGYSPYKENSLLPDYVGIARRSLTDVDSLMNDMRPWLSGLSQREAIARVLMWVQSIPYSVLQDRDDDAGFLPPISVLQQNRGDCDSKSVLLATLLHLLYPDLPVAMILMETHALIGIGIPVDQNDMTWRHENFHWVLAEPAGPGLLPLGRAGDELAKNKQAVEAVLRLF